MTKYSSSYDPPALIAKLALKKIESADRLRDVEVLLDTGSDITLLPKTALDSLDFPPEFGTKISLVAFDGSVTEYDIYELQIDFMGLRFTGKYCAIDDPIGILGRDVLNKVSLLLDGPNLEWDIIKS